MSTSTSIIIFGLSGDLAQRKLIPALFNLYQKGRLNGDFQIIGFAGRAWSDEDLCNAARSGIEKYADYKIDETAWNKFSDRLF